MSLDVHIVSTDIGALAGTAVWPLFLVPTYGGGISILGGHAAQGGSVNSSLRLVTLGAAGTAADGTITSTAIGGTATPFANGVPKAFTISTAFVPAGKYVGVEETGVVACNARCAVSLSYVMGRSY
jgi:hypothetical protein